MQYIRKKPKGFGRNAQIEGEVCDGARALLVEDLATDGGSKINFITALREAGQRCDHAFVFFYDIFPKARQTMTDLGVGLHYLATWRDILGMVRTSAYFEPATLDKVEAFLDAPLARSMAHGGVLDLPAKTPPGG